MLVKMKRENFESLDDGSLIRSCMEPVFQSVRGKSPEIKAQMYSSLNEHQQALFMYLVFVDHSRGSAAEFYCWTFFLLAEPKTWSEIGKALRHFRVDSLLQFLEETECTVQSVNGKADRQGEARPGDLEDDPELRHAVEQLYERFRKLLPDAEQRISSLIRNRADLFVEL